MRFAHKLTIGGQETRLLSDRWFLERNAPGRAILEVDATQPLTGLVTYAIGWGDTIEPWFTGYVHTSLALDAKRQRVRVHEIDRALLLPVPMSLRNATVRDMLGAIADKTGVTWSIGSSVDLQTRFAHLVNLATARASLQRLGELLAIPDWTIQALPTGEIYLGAAAGLRPATLQLPTSLLTDVTATGAGLRALPRIRPGTYLQPGNGNTMKITAVELSAETYRLHWTRA